MRFNLVSYILSGFLFTWIAGPTQAAAPVPFARNCWDLAAHRYGVDAWLLLALAQKESGLTSGALGINRNKTEDLGLTQINSIHLEEMKRYGVSRHDLLHNDCKNIYAAAYLLSRCMARYGNNIDGIGCYHSKTPSLRRRYGQSVLRLYHDLIQKHYIRQEPFKLKRRRPAP